MLSIGKLSAGQEGYYQQQVAHGRDDYYSGRGEAPGRWTGRLAAELGLEGQVSSEAFGALLLEGKDPRTGEQLRTASKITAYDFTFSAPKSVSVLFAIADEETSAALRDAHDQAVNAALGWLERDAVFGRRGKAGHERVAGAGVVAGAYRHRMSRAQDPQLHTHVVAANLTRGPDGRWGALHAYPAYQAAKAAGCLYEAELRLQVRERLPWVEWGTVGNGIAEIEGVRPEVLAEFSQRRAQILEWVAEHGDADAGLRNENAVLATRARKNYGIDTPTFREQIRARAAEHGLGDEELRALMAHEVDAAVVAVTDGEAAMRAYLQDGPPGLEAHLGTQLAGPAGLTRMRNTFGNRHLVEALAGAQRQGASVTDIEASGARFLGRGDVRDVVDPDGARYTTDDLLAHERAIVAGAERRQGEGVGRVDRAVVARVLASRAVVLNDDQRAVVERLTSSGHGLEHVEALAGTGKTTMLGAIAEAYRQAGYRVIGTAKTGRAVRELKERAEVPDSWTGSSLVGSMDRYGIGFGRGPVVLLFDEAGMSDTREASRIIAEAERAGVKVIAVGDSGQLTSVEAGGWLGALTRRSGALELTEVMRQRDPAERSALTGVRDGHPDRYLSLQRGRGALTVQATAEAAERDAVAAWWQAQQQTAHGQAVMVARDNARRERLNTAARQLLKAAGLLPASGAEIGGREFVVGDRVIARRNDRLRDVDNGMRGTVVTVDPDTATVTIEADAGGRRELDRGYAEEHLEHAYALTGHGTQGGTLERAVIVGRPEEFSRNWGYTALSRAREQTRVVLVAERRVSEHREELAPSEQVDRSREETLAAMAGSLRHADAEDLALEQLQAQETGAAIDLGADTPVAQPLAQEASADRLDAASAPPSAPGERSPDAVAETAEQDTVEVPEPVDRYRRMLGEQRASWLAGRTAAHAERNAGRPDTELRTQREQADTAFARLDRSGAYEVRRVEHARGQANERVREALDRARALEEQAGQRGRRQRAQRAGLLAEAQVQRQLGSSAEQDLARLDQAEAQLRSEGRHVDDWLTRDGEQAAAGLAAERELATRRERTIRAHTDRAVEQPPAHVRDAIGDAPEQDAGERERWQQLARDLERHRLTHEFDADRHGALGPEPDMLPAERRSTYERDQRELARRVDALRGDRGLPPSERAPAVEAQTPDVGREI